MLDCVRYFLISENINGFNIFPDVRKKPSQSYTKYI
jgi:hypothetical protein